MNLSAKAAAKAPREPYRFMKHIGSTRYNVAVHFSRTSLETAGDKIARLIRNDTAAGKHGAATRKAVNE